MKQIFRFIAISLLVLLTASPSAQAAGRKVLAADYSKKRIAIVNEAGKVEWEHPIRQSHDLHLLPTGNILFQTSWREIVEMTPDKKIVWKYDAGKMNGNEGKKVEVHAFQRLDGGLTMIAESGPGRIIEVDKQGRIRREVKLKLDQSNAHSDTRLVRKTRAGTYLVSHENDTCVREYNSEGKVIWEYEIPMFGKEAKRGHGLEAYGNRVYSAIRLPNGNTLIGTGNGHSVLEVTPGKKVVWSIHQNDLEGIQLAWVTTVARLPNGNTVIGNCHAGPENPQIIEVTSEKEVVWSFKDFDLFGNALASSEVLGVNGNVIR
ncbi:MAG: hypothetical protein ACI9VS_000873 [Candidatus Binatia bacterium]|jgi:hypothetical protein